MNSIKEWLKGKKTIITSISAVLVAVAAWASGEASITTVIEAAFAAAMAMGLHAAVTRQ